MAGLQRSLANTYRLVLDEDGRGVARTIEFEAMGAEGALFHAHRHCAGREAELFENGHSLGRLKNSSNYGFWVLRSKAA